MNGAVANVLNSVLGEFVENLDANQLKLSVFSGQVELNNLQVKTSFIGKLGLPFVMNSGSLGKIKLTIPWTSLTSSPLIVNIE